MQVFMRSSGLSRTSDNEGRYQIWSIQNRRYQEFPHPKEPTRNKIIPRNDRLLPKVHTRLHGHGETIISSRKKTIWYVWSECDSAFETLKKCITSEPILQYPDFKKTFYLTTDASIKAIAAVLSQQSGEGEDLPITYASRTLLDAETRYTTTEQELRI